MCVYACVINFDLQFLFCTFFSVACVCGYLHCACDQSHPTSIVLFDGNLICISSLHCRHNEFEAQYESAAVWPKYIATGLLLNVKGQHITAMCDDGLAYACIGDRLRNGSVTEKSSQRTGPVKAGRTTAARYLESNGSPWLNGQHTGHYAIQQSFGQHGWSARMQRNRQVNSAYAKQDSKVEKMHTKKGMHLVWQRLSLANAFRCYRAS